MTQRKYGGGPKGVVPTEEEQKTAKEMIARLGEEAAAAKVGVTANTIAKLAAGCTVSKGSLAQLRLAAQGGAS